MVVEPDGSLLCIRCQPLKKGIPWSSLSPPSIEFVPITIRIGPCICGSRECKECTPTFL